MWIQVLLPVISLCCFVTLSMKLHAAPLRGSSEAIEMASLFDFDDPMRYKDRMSLQEVYLRLDPKACTKKEIGLSTNVKLYNYQCPNENFKPSSFNLTRAISVAPTLYPRIWFWHRIYTVFSQNEYVLHSGAFPEVIFAVAKYDGDSTNARLVKKNIDQVIDIEKDRYRRILTRLAKGDDWAKLDPAALAVVRSMAHISDKQKYAKAAASLRTQRGQKEFIKMGIEMASPYILHIESEFKKIGLPTELAYVAFVESSFNLHAVSRVRASGVYQLMPFVAREHMIISAHIDERKDPIKAGIVAAKLFKQNYTMLKNWPLAITAYNHGPYGIKMATQTVRSNDLCTIIENYNGKRFGFASKNFFAEFVAVHIAVKGHRQYYEQVVIGRPLTFANLKLARPTSVRQIKSKYRVSLSDLRRLNPDVSFTQLGLQGVLPRGFVLKLPTLTATAKKPPLGHTQYLITSVPNK